MIADPLPGSTGARRWMPAHGIGPERPVGGDFAMRWTRPLMLLGFGAYVASLFFIALFLFPAGHPPPNLVPFRTMAADWRGGGWPFVVNFLGNLVAFLPMGAVPRLTWPRRFRPWHAALFGLALSLMIEGGQLYSGRRVFDVDDLILNTIGSVAGFALAARGRSGIGPKRR